MRIQPNPENAPDDIPVGPESQDWISVFFALAGSADCAQSRISSRNRYSQRKKGRGYAVTKSGSGMGR